jgi:ABC-type amino acid transport substrate-binding protein
MKSIRLLAGAMLLSMCATAAAVSLIHTAAQISSEPKFVAVTTNGKPAIGGICVDIMRAIERVEPGLRFVGDQSWQPRTRIQAGLKAGSIDAACGLLRVDERNAIFNFVDTPLFAVQYRLAVRADDNVQVGNWDDVAKLGDNGVILVTQGFGIIDILGKVSGLTIDAGADTAESNLNKLLARRGRFYCHRSPGIMTEIKKAGLQDKVKLLPAIMQTENFYMALARTMAPGDAKKLNAAIASLQRRGELARMFDKYRD